MAPTTENTMGAEALRAIAGLYEGGVYDLAHLLPSGRSWATETKSATLHRRGPRRTDGIGRRGGRRKRHPEHPRKAPAGKTLEMAPPAGCTPPPTLRWPGR